uniref:Exportin-4 n=1 Tax=Romanomermis culicivorax TaxID=13658 RepID=A0A915IE64_ROMCU
MKDDFLKYPSICSQLFRLITSLCQLYPSSVMGYSSEFRRNTLLLIERGLSFDYGNDTVKSCLDILQVLASFAHNLSDDVVVNVKMDLGHFIKIVFETSLKCSSQIDLLHDSTACLFALICLNEALYQNFVQQLIYTHHDQSTQRSLVESFGKLLPHSVHGLKAQQYRKERLSFRDRFETFLDNIQGTLCYS